MAPSTELPVRRAAALLPAIVASAAGLGGAAEAQTTHALPLTPENIHWGYYDASLEPAVRIRSGDSVTFENLLARGLDRLRLHAGEFPCGATAQLGFEIPEGGICRQARAAGRQHLQ